MMTNDKNIPSASKKTPNNQSPKFNLLLQKTQTIDFLFCMF